MDNNMKKIIVTQERSAINRTQRQKRTLVALGLKRIGQSIEHDATANILGMIKKVNHLVSFKED
jgi:large subunit ribosomal protein L30